MSKQKSTEIQYDDGGYSVKKSRKFNIFAFIMCFLIAFIIWLYASNIEEKNKAEDQTAVPAHSHVAEYVADAYDVQL